MTPKRAGSLMTALRSPGLGSAKMTATSSALYTDRSNGVFSSVVDPDPDTDPVGSETFSRIRTRIWKIYSGSEQLRIRNECEVKLL
jgi:hypothetical protein